jgi:hypothetical protein
MHQVKYLVDDDSHLFTAKFAHLSDCLHVAASGTPCGTPRNKPEAPTEQSSQGRLSRSRSWRVGEWDCWSLTHQVVEQPYGLQVVQMILDSRIIILLDIVFQFWAAVATKCTFRSGKKKGQFSFLDTLAFSLPRRIRCAT